jgi:Holliday junction resolvase RusA-like endonuclease
MIHFTVPGPPCPQPRQRHRIMFRKGAWAMTVGAAIRAKMLFVQNYTPSTDPVNAFKEAVQIMARNEHRGPLWEGVVGVELAFFLSDSDRRHNADLDNLSKAVLDALKGIVWKDDKQVTGLILTKAFSSKPRTEVSLWSRAEQPQLFEASA